MNIVLSRMFGRRGMRWAGLEARMGSLYSILKWPAHRKAGGSHGVWTYSRRLKLIGWRGHVTADAQKLPKLVRRRMCRILQ